VTAVAAVAGRHTPLDESLRRLRTLVSPYSGLIRGVTELTAAPDDARLVRVACHVADLEPLIGVDTELRPGGSAADRDTAIAATIGEVAERYSGAWVPRGLPLAAADELPGAVDPERFSLFHATQHAQPRFPFRAFTGRTRVRWTPAIALPSGEAAYVPAQLVYLRWRSPADTGEEAIAYSTSNGVACGATFDEAVASALLELLERDAFMLTWYGRHSLPRLDWSADPALAAFDARYFRPSGVRYAAVDLSVFHDVPSVLGIVRGAAGDGAPLAVGAAARATLGEAWVGALAEAFAVRSWARAMSHERGPRTFAPDFADIDGFDDHVAFYADESNTCHADFLDASDVTRATAEVSPLEGATAAQQIAALCARLAARGMSAYAVDITAPDVAAAGLRVARVIVPELQPLDVAYAGRFLGGRRLYRAAFELGLRASPMMLQDLNPYPHPFP
jgi:ribosomal protein S12 methylthiotransferase accessory factor